MGTHMYTHFFFLTVLGREPGTHHVVGVYMHFQPAFQKLSNKLFPSHPLVAQTQGTCQWCHYTLVFAF